MSTSKRSGEIDRKEVNRHRRRSFGATAITVAAAHLGMVGAGRITMATSRINPAASSFSPAIHRTSTGRNPASTSPRSPP